MRPKLQKQSALKLAGRIIPCKLWVMRPKLQKQSALKLAGRIIPQFTAGYISFSSFKAESIRQAFQKLLKKQ